MPEVVTGPGPAELKILVAKLAAADPELRRVLRKRLREASRPVVAEVQAAALTMPAHKYPDRGLRAEIARTVYASVGTTRSGVRMNIISAGRRMPRGKQNMNALTDRPSGWGHPVFPRVSLSRRKWTWVRQVEAPRWFERSVVRAHPAAVNAAHEALNDIKDYLE